MQVSSEFVNVGTDTQVSVKPTVIKTTTYAIRTFTPEQRNCYQEGEVNLTYLPYVLGYHYDMNNCLFNKGVHDIIWNCRCYPIFIKPELVMERKGLPLSITSCTGEKLYCANQIIQSIGIRIITLFPGFQS